jgi:hypothetical protein
LDSDRFWSVTAKLDRARGLLLRDFAALEAQFAERPALVLNDQPTGQGTAEIRVSRIEDWAHFCLSDLSLIAGDFVHNVRTALDHLIYAVVTEPDGQTMFPVWRSKPHGPGAVTKMLKQRGLTRAPRGIADGNCSAGSGWLSGVAG